jgi:transcriptional regulator with XRE-family HTH domain
MADLKEIVAINVRQLRHEKGWTQEELADRVGLSARYVGQIERAQASMTVTVLGRIAEALKVEASELVRRRAKSRRGSLA